MKRYLSLATAILMGTVKAKDPLTKDSFVKPAVLGKPKDHPVVDFKSTRSHHNSHYVPRAALNNHKGHRDHHEEEVSSFKESASSESSGAHEVQRFNDGFESVIESRGRDFSRSSSQRLHSRPVSNDHHHQYIERNPSAPKGYHSERGRSPAVFKDLPIVQIRKGACRSCRAHGVRAPCWWTGSGWEWRNKWEPDGTPDNSPFTSIDTDFILETSPDLDGTDPSNNDHDSYVRRSCNWSDFKRRVLRDEFIELDDVKFTEIKVKKIEKTKVEMPNKRFESVEKVK